MNKQLGFEPIELEELEGVLGGADSKNNGCIVTNGKCSEGGCGICNGKCGPEEVKDDTDDNNGTIEEPSPSDTKGK